MEVAVDDEMLGNGEGVPLVLNERAAFNQLGEGSLPPDRRQPVSYVQH